MEYIINMMDDSFFEINEEEKNAIEQAIFKNSKFVKIGTELLNTSSISSIVTKSAFQIKNAYKNNEWVCDYGFRHLKHEHCACGYHARLGLEPDSTFLISDASGTKKINKAGSGGFVSSKQLLENFKTNGKRLLEAGNQS